ncbi:MAG: hypothetical protein MI806_13895 [Minwuiales bacterium]|nr:hypothetical protein [Minwuiales bacterium]
MIGKSDLSFGQVGLKGLAALFDTGATAKRIATRLLTTAPDEESRRNLDRLRDANETVTRVRQENDPAKLRRQAAERKIEEAKQKIRQLRMFGGLSPKAVAREVQRVLRDLAQAVGAYASATKELGESASAGTQSAVADARAAGREAEAAAEAEARAAEAAQVAEGEQAEDRAAGQDPEAAVRAYAEGEQRRFAERAPVFDGRRKDQEVLDEARRVVAEAKSLLEDLRRRRDAPEEADKDRDAVAQANAALHGLGATLRGRPAPAIFPPTSVSV